MKIKEPVIFWDWNGTLLDDLDICIDTMNQVLMQRDMPLVSEEKYKSIFGFPIIEYYKKLGFDLEKVSFEELSVEFMDGYHSRVGQAPLHKDSHRILRRFMQLGKKQVVISALEESSLKGILAERELRHYFESVNGLNNIYAQSKVHLAQAYIKKTGISPNDVVFIGDTEHDFEVAEKIGCRCILVSHGHHSPARLLETGASIVASFQDLLNDSEKFLN